MKLDMQGNIIWQQTWDEGLEKDERQDGHIVVDETHMYMTGISQGIPNAITALSGFDGQATIWKFDRQGNYVDHDTWGPEEIWIDGDDALGMTTDGTHLYAVGYVWTAGDNADWFIRKYDKNLNMIWEDIWGGVNGESGRSATVDDQGNIWCAVNTFSNPDTVQNLALLKYSTDGDLDGYYVWGDSTSQHTQDIRFHDGALYCSGGTTSNSTGNENPYLIRVDIDDLVTSGPIPDYPDFQLNVYPNPAAEQLSIEYSGIDTQRGVLRINDLNGRLMFERKVDSGNQLELNVREFNSGFYFVTVETEIRRFTKAIEIVR